MKTINSVLVFTTIISLSCSNTDACTQSITTASGTHAPTEICSGNLIFEDNFDQLDNRKWQHENTLAGGGNWEFQWYTNNRSNSFTKNGILYIRPSLLSDHFGEKFLTSGVLNVDGGAPADRCTDPTHWGCERVGTAKNILNPIKSARLRTVNSFKFRYGKVEISAKMPAGDWLWPAIWFMPAYNMYGSWPASGEIDLVESRGNKNLLIQEENIGVEQIGTTLHFGPSPTIKSSDKTHFTVNDTAGYHTSFKKYQMEWTPEDIKFFINNIHTGTFTPPKGGFWEYGEFPSNVENPWRYGTKMAPFDQEFYIILNLAVGGINFFPDEASNPDVKPWKNTSPTAMRDFWNQRSKWLTTWGLNINDGEHASLKVDYVKVWAL